MAFEGLAQRLQGTLQKITGKGKINEADVKEMMREVRFALIEADVNLKVVKEFVKTVSERAVGQDVMKSLTPGQQVVKIVKDELTKLMGGEQNPIQFAQEITDSHHDGRSCKGQGKRRRQGNWRQSYVNVTIKNRCSLRQTFTDQPLSNSWKHLASS